MSKKEAAAIVAMIKKAGEDATKQIKKKNLESIKFKKEIGQHLLKEKERLFKQRHLTA